ncbi:RNA polymerase sigma factor [Psychroflexus salis]|uniref:DNA-directed RNA polymerase sigma-70 factor n=1 Tax=Psychroflexus salis TaxID=1526574 RepID=A0A916ZY07_9FLAO|nr:sigma-70 family RNA polymerase sigma factor [Psychroflexus salis]GGE17473.1 DNA-directed RNA polymerase sigma-70 factor [Psychroflexus salis]
MNSTQFIENIQAFEAKMYRLAKYILTSEDAAKDALQEVFMKLWQQKNKLNTVDYLEAYVMRITKNYCFDQLKLKENQNLRLFTEEIENETNEENYTVDNEREKKLKIQLIKAALNELPPLQALVMQLRDLENYSFNEIAEILTITEGAARVNLSRARKTVIKKIKNKSL